MAYRNERVFASAYEVTRELEKVTWPTRKETIGGDGRRHRDGAASPPSSSSGFDCIWSFFTNWFLR